MLTRPPCLSREDYLARVRACLLDSAPRLAELAVDSINRWLGSPDKEAFLIQGLEAFQEDPTTGHAGLVEIYDLSQARSVFDLVGLRICNWHYDRKARALIINLRRGSHDGLSTALYEAYAGSSSIQLKQEEAAERFLSEGLGWFRSSVAKRPIKGASVHLDAQERAAFRSLDFHLI